MAEQMSKSAKKRAAKQTRDAQHTEAPAPVAAAAPKAAAKAEVKAPPKAEAKPAAAQPKAKAKDGKAQPKKKAAEEAKAPAPVRKASDPNYALNMDDGSGAAWESVAQGKKTKKKGGNAAAESDWKQDGKQGNQYEATQKAGGGAAKKTDAFGAEAAIARSRGLVASSQEPNQAPTGGASGEEAAAAPANSKSIHVPQEKIARIIGPKGATINMIKDKTGCKIDAKGEEFTISGEDAADVAKAELAIKEMVEKGFMSLAYDDFQQCEVMAPPSSFPDIIGKGGCIIIAIKNEYKVEINIPAVPKTSKKPAGISVAGSKAQVDEAKKCIEDIVQYYHHKTTHPGEDHVEISDLAGWEYSFIIGKGGSQLKHIQNNYKVRVYIPRETSQNQNVVIVGAKVDCERAEKFIRAEIAKANEVQTDKRKDKADDHWGDEEEEPWMNSYMYKRK